MQSVSPSTSVLRRFVNRVVDFCAIVALLGILAVAAGLLLPEERLDEVEAWIEGIPGTIAILCAIVVYYLIAEGLTGRTLGKLVTRTHVVDEQGHRPAFPKILARSVLRLVPLGWIGLLEEDRRALHDFGSKTYVVGVQKPSNNRLERQRHE